MDTPGPGAGAGQNNVLTYAINILTRAVTLDSNKRYTEALVCYQEGLQILMDALKTMGPNEDSKKLKIRGRVEEYMKRAENLKGHIETLKSDGKYREQLQIGEDSTGHSYHSVFSRFMDYNVRVIEVDDPYIRSVHQCDNFLRFVELSTRLCPQLNIIKLTTGKDPKQPNAQTDRLNTIKNSLENFKNPTNIQSIRLIINYSDSLHDREIRFDNGWVIKIGRGLDYFKPIDRLNIGFSDYDLRPCKETTIDIFHKKELVACNQYN